MASTSHKVTILTTRKRKKRYAWYLGL
jgi:hypothetical protein